MTAECIQAKLPLSVSSFPIMVEENFIYVDKTEYVHRLIEGDGRIYFLSRPRRFGKTLLISIFKEIFSGNKELFKGCWIYDHRNPWEKFPVFHLDFQGVDFKSFGLEKALMKKLDSISKQIDIKVDGESSKEKFGNLIQNLSAKEKKRVVILIDEYDKPIIEYIENNKKEKSDENREILRNFYSELKNQEGNIKFLFITGVSRFTKVSIFSHLNNLVDITLNKDYASMFGYTRQEIGNYFDFHIDKWMRKEKNVNKSQLMERLKDEYNGYSWDGKNFVYNPDSIHKSLYESSFGSYWFSTGTPTFLVKKLIEQGIDIANFENMTVKQQFFDGFDISDIKVNLLLFQTGYLTIKELLGDDYRIYYPNKEVQTAFLHLLLEKYSHKDHDRIEAIIRPIHKALAEKNIEVFVYNIRPLLADIPFNDSKDISRYEGFYHSIIFIALKLSNINVISEKANSIGRTDLVVKTDKYIYIIEFKMVSADEALKQILEKKYYEPFLSEGKEIILVGIGFSEKERNIADFDYIAFDSQEKINPVLSECTGVIALLNFLECKPPFPIEPNKTKEVEYDIESRLTSRICQVHGRLIKKMETGYLLFFDNQEKFLTFCIGCDEILSNGNLPFDARANFQIMADTGVYEIFENSGRIKKVLDINKIFPSIIEQNDGIDSLVVSEFFYHSLKNALSHGNTKPLKITKLGKRFYSFDFAEILGKLGSRQKADKLLKEQDEEIWKIKDIGLRIFDSAGYHPYDKNFNYYRQYTGPTFQGLLGSPNFKHNDCVTCVAISPDGKSVISWSDDKTIKWWDLETGKEIKMLKVLDNHARGAFFGPNGKTIIFVSGENTIKWVNLETDLEIRTLRGHKDCANCIALSPDGKTIISGSDDKTIKYWDLVSCREICTLEGHEGHVDCIAFSPDGNTVISGSDDKTIKWWNLESGREINTFKGHAGPVNCISFSPGGKTIISGSDDKTIRWWDLDTGQLIRTFTGHTDHVKRVVFSPGGQTVISASWDNTIKGWDMETGREICTFKGHDQSITTIALSPDGKTVISASWDKTLKWWDLPSGKEIRTFIGHSGHINSATFSPDGKIMVSGSDDSTLRSWDLESGKETKTFRGHELFVNSIAFSPDGQTLISGSRDSTLKWWDLESGKEKQTFVEHRDHVNSVCFSPDGKTVISGSFDKTLKWWDLESGKAIKTFSGHENVISSVSFLNKSKTVVSGSFDNTLKLWDLETGKAIRTFKGHQGFAWSIAISPDDKTVISGSDDKTLKQWDLETGEAIKTFTGHDGHVYSVDFSPDGQTAVSGSSDQTLKLWNLRTGEITRTFKGHDGIVWSVVFSPDGKYIVSCSWDYSIKIWERETGKCIETIALLWRPKEIKPSPIKKGLYACANGNGTIALFDFSEIMK